MDGVLELEDGTLMNIEFQTGNIGEKFLLRCAQYAINLRIISGKLVETNIISTGIRNNSKLMALISKLFSFRPKIFFYSEYDGSERLSKIKDKIKNQEKLSQEDHYNLVFIPLMGNVDRVKVAFEVFKIVNDKNLFNEDEQAKIKQFQYVVAQIVADDDEKLLDEFWGVIKMNNNFLVEYETNLVENTRKAVTEEVTEAVTREVTREVTVKLAKNLKDVLEDSEIAKRTGLSLEDVQNL